MKFVYSKESILSDMIIPDAISCFISFVVQAKGRPIVVPSMNEVPVSPGLHALLSAVNDVSDLELPKKAKPVTGLSILKLDASSKRKQTGSRKSSPGSSRRSSSQKRVKTSPTAQVHKKVRAFGVFPLNMVNVLLVIYLD